MSLTDTNDLLELWKIPHPDDIGQSEFRAIYECVSDGLYSLDDDEATEAYKITVAIGMLDEFEGWAKSMKKTIRTTRKKKGIIYMISH